MPAAIDPELKSKARALYVGGQMPAAIATSLGIKRQTIIHWATNHKWGNDRQIVEQSTAKVVNALASRELREIGERTRTLLAESCLKQAELLASKPAMSLEALGNTPMKQGHAAILKTVTDTALALHCWGDDKISAIVAIGTLPRFDTPPAQVQEAEVIKPCESAERLLTEESNKPSEPV